MTKQTSVKHPEFDHVKYEFSEDYRKGFSAGKWSHIKLSKYRRRTFFVFGLVFGITIMEIFK